MASAQNQKRAFADDLSKQHRPSKKVKSRGRLQAPSNFPPEFWDELSKVWPTRRALRELDRRRSAQPAPAPDPGAPEVSTTNLGRFSRHGGPDLRHLRGYPEPKGAVIQTMAPSCSSPPRRQTKSTKPTGVTPRTKPLSAYDANFECHMADNSIFSPFYDFPDNGPIPTPNNFDEDQRVLLTRRRSLSVSHFTQSAFENFRRKHNTASESTVKRNLIPIIAGDADIPNYGDLTSTNIESITEGLTTVKVAPDFFDGARLSDVYRKIRDEKEEDNLNKLIIPTKRASAPAVPNFLETKALEAGANVALLQALHDGAIGARAMHALQNYGAEEPTFDGNAYTYSSTYHAGTGSLQLYMHHATPLVPGGRPQYYMTKLRGFEMTDCRETFIQGATVFRNARDLAQKHRQSFIQVANARAHQAEAGAQQALPEPGITPSVAEQGEDTTEGVSTSGEFLYSRP